MLRNKKSLLAISTALTFLPLMVSAKTFTEALSTGKTTLNERLRFESVDDEAFTGEAEAMTARTRLGYETAPFADFTALIEMEDIHTIGGMNNYQLPAPPVPVATGDAVIADPESTELNRVQLRYRGLPRLDLTLGRQRLIFDNQRFIGNVGFRQDEQTFEAFSALYNGIPNWIFNYAFVDRVNGITNVLNADVNDQLFNIAYTGFVPGKFSVYSYELKNEESNVTVLNPALRYDSNDTIGLRFDGGYVLPLTVPLRAIYRAEYAQQDVKLKTGETYDTDYRLLEAGLMWTFGTYALTPMIGDEVLGSDDSRRASPTVDTGLYAFQTPYATKHAFNGWVDQFLVTPNQGLDDRYASLAFDINAYTTKILLVYHDYQSDANSAVLNGKIDFGSESNIQIMKTFGANWTIGAKYGQFKQANTSNVAVSGKKDADKVWAWAELNF